MNRILAKAEISVRDDAPDLITFTFGNGDSTCLGIIEENVRRINEILEGCGIPRKDFWTDVEVKGPDNHLSIIRIGKWYLPSS